MSSADRPDPEGVSSVQGSVAVYVTYVTDMGVTSPVWGVIRIVDPIKVGRRKNRPGGLLGACVASRFLG